MSSLKKKVVLVGDAGCGKSALAVKLTENMFLDVYEPTEFEDFQTEVYTAKGNCKLTLLDTSGSHNCDNIRSLTYRGCDAVIVCFDLTDATTLNSIESFWLPEVKTHCPNTPLYIAGCKRDAMCTDSTDGKRCKCGGNCCTQTESELLDIIKRTGAVAYTECSAAFDIDEGVSHLFEVVIETSTQQKKAGAKKVISKLKKQSKSIRRRLSVFSL